MNFKLKKLSAISLTVIAGLFAGAFGAYAAAAAAPGLVKAQKEAEAKGYVFATSQEEIIANAKKEGKLRVMGSLDAKTLRALSEAFRKKYPFIDAQAQEIAGTDNYIRMIQEMRAGMAKGWDVNYVAFDMYPEYMPYQKKFDILGMAQHGVLQIPQKMVDPVNRHIVVVASDLQVVAFNKKSIAAEKIPNNWEGFLREEFSGRKFMLDIRPKDLAALIPAWGMEKTVEYARKLAAQKPVWIRGNSRAMTMIQSGEYSTLFGPNIGTVMELEKKDPNIGLKILEPVPTRLNEAQAVLNAASNPYAGLLWLEFVTSAPAQALLDQLEPVRRLLSHRRFDSGKVSARAQAVGGGLGACDQVGRVSKENHRGLWFPAGG